MRIPIREQLGLLVLFCCLFALMVLSVATWQQNHGFIIGIRRSALSLAASLKSAQVSASLLLLQTSVQSIATRIVIQSALQRYNDGNDTEANWIRTRVDLEGAMSGATSDILLQTIIFPKNDTGTGNVNGLVNVTGQIPGGPIKLPAVDEDGGDVYLGDDGLGYPPQLYPNLTYTSTAIDETFNQSQAFYNGSELLPGSTLIIGPYAVNETFYLLSMTTAINNNTSEGETLGWLTVVLNPSLIYDVTTSPEGLDETGEVLLVAPATPNNKFTQNVQRSEPAFVGKQEVQFVFAPPNNESLGNRHNLRASGSGDPSMGFAMGDFPAVVDAWTKNNSAINNAGALISSRNEEGQKVSVGYATVSTRLVDWVLVFEQSYGEVIAPVAHLRDVVLACVFGTTGLIMLLLFPLAHFAVRPIRQLRAATSKTVQPIPPSNSSDQSLGSQGHEDTSDGDGETYAASPPSKKEGFLHAVSRWRNGGRSPVRAGLRYHGRRRSFKIPGKVPERPHWLNDELTDLTSTFNEMSDELVLQYARLEERVKERTAELEESKKAAEAANASKTLFIANISHELKTPLNGILGMCTVCMQEDDNRKIKQSLGIIYKSGDLLLHLLTDLLTFSKNSIGQQLTIDESEFRLLDISIQVTSIFEKQAREGDINLQVEFLGTSDAFGNTSEDAGPKLYGPSGTGRVRDMCLWGDKNRILQVLINLVSNSLKFTPPGGSVHVKISCTGLAEDMIDNKVNNTRKSSVQSKQSRQSRSSWKRKAENSDTSLGASPATSEKGSDKKKDAKSDAKKSREINFFVAGRAKQLPQIAVRRRSISPPPLNTKHLAIEFAVTDTGPGIPEEQMSRIFEPFVQGDLGLSKKFAGTGLGLSICAQLANLMGGGITLQSTMGSGSTFSVQIPLRYVKQRAASTSSSQGLPRSRPSSVVGQSLREEALSRNVAVAGVRTNDLTGDHPPREDVPRIVGFSQPYFPQDVTRNDLPQDKLSEMKKAEQEAARRGEKVRVLVAEDNKVNQEVVTRMLKLESVYDVTIAKDGQEALDLVRESMQVGQRFNLVFMDVQMPNLDGIQSTKLIREIGFSAPIVALTAFSEESNIKDCYESGMDFFLPKPIRRPELKKVLSKYCPTIHEDEAENVGAAVPKIDNTKSLPSAENKGSSKLPVHDSLRKPSASKETIAEDDSNGVPQPP